MDRSTLAVLLLLLVHTPAAAQSLATLGIEVRGTSRPFLFTNKESAFYYGETGGDNTTSWQGFNVRNQEFLDDYLLLVEGKEFRRSSATRCTVYPDHLERQYPGGIVEEVWPADSIPLVAIELTFPVPADAGFLPLIGNGTPREDLVVRLRKGMAFVARKLQLAGRSGSREPVWLGIASPGALPETVDIRRGRQTGPVRLYGGKARRHLFVFAVGSTPEELEHLLGSYPAQAARYKAQRQARMQKLLSGSTVTTGDPAFTTALAWAKLSLDALVMNQTGKGIFAGLPWFNNYWGRDTFIALPGATLVTARHADARDILRSFAGFQQRDSTRSDFGRVPNIVTTTDTAYNTADGTPRFVMMIQEYVERSGDESLLLELYPVILRSIEGALRFHTDSSGFLTHGDAETWMDAVGPDGPWSPRGNRANDIQALWARQLETGIWAATRLGDVRSAQRWTTALRLLRASFRSLFVRGETVVDHLAADGTPSIQLRPNQIFTVPLLSPLERASMLHTVVTRLTYPYGVASLAQTDDSFHPYHTYPPFYPKDAAYHNGTVWTWLQGPVISEMCAFGAHDSAYVLTANAVHQILSRGAVGTQSELLDALARPGEKEPRLSGTVSQAWNLAEFTRNFYDDYLGLRIEELTRRITLQPRVPLAMDSIMAVLPVGGQQATFRISHDTTGYRVTLAAPPLPAAYQFSVLLPGLAGRGTKTTFAYGGGTSVAIQAVDTLVTVTAPGLPVSPAVTVHDAAGPGTLLHRLHFAVPHLRPGLPALAPPPYTLLQHGEVTATPPETAPIVDAVDPSGDDIGVGPVRARGEQYTYPASAHFVPGSFDITGFTVRTDAARAYFSITFRALSDPGWHPEYGFQLTFAAIAIDTDRQHGSGTTGIPASAQYHLPPGRGYEILILVGGGIRVEDASGTIRAAYMPAEADAARPFGDAASGTIRFALPFDLIGRPAAGWSYTLLAGAQDDHGGAGIGEFRAVHQHRGEWNGGGRLSPAEPNVYDELIIP